MTTTGYKEPNPQNFKPALALVQRYLATSYRVDPALALEAAALAEQMEAAALMQQCPAQCIVMHCRRTGQPVAYMPVARMGTHLPLTVALNWMHTGPQAIERLSDEQPIAALVFAVMALTFPGDSYCDDAVMRKMEPDTVARYAQRSDRVRELFLSAAALPAQALARLASLLIEFNATVTDAAKQLAALRDVVRSEGPASDVWPALEAVIAREYAVMIARTKSLFHIQSALALDDEAMIDQCQGWLTAATGQRLAQMRQEIAVAKEKHQAAVREATERRKSASQRAQERVLKAAKEAFGDALDAMFDPVIPGAPAPAPAPATPHDVVLRMDTGAHKPASFTGFNIFKAAGVQSS